MRVLIPILSDKDTLDEEALKQEVIDKYNQLFADFDEEYHDFFYSEKVQPHLDVNSIVTFYRGLNAVLDPNSGQEPPKNRFFRLPLDEPEFVINMDNRSITVPKVFSDYGFGVKGDTNAEVVFFKCDRYYDGVDLTSMIQELSGRSDVDCVVQWQNLISGEAGNSRVILADTAEDYIIFGWMITSKMTSKPGTIEFAVRWTQTKDDKIVYSVSTQKASCLIKSTLDLDYETIGVENVSDVVFSRPFYAGVINSMSGSAPRVAVNLEEATRDLEPLDPETQAELLEQYPLNDYPDGILILTVDATSPDGMPIRYRWYNGDATIPGDQAKTNTLYVTEPGKYYVKIGNDGSSENRGIRWVTSNVVTVPSPDAIKFVDQQWFGMGTYSDGAETHVPSVEVKNISGETPTGTLVYTWKKADMIVNNVAVKVADLTDADYTVVAGETGPSLVPPVGTEAYYKCEVYNKHNNDRTEVLKTAEPATLRAVPGMPISVTIAFDNNTKVLSVANIDWGTAPGKYHPDEIRYEWGSLEDGKYTAGFGNEFKSFNAANLHLKNNTEPWSSDFYCKVQHVVFKDNPDGQERASAEKTSNLYTLHIGLDENLQPTVTG